MSAHGPQAGGPDPTAARRFAALWTALERELDWRALGVALCSEGGEERFGDEDRAALLDTGLAFADDLARELPRGGRSLWIGASVAELVPLLVEALCLGREVLWHELDGPVTRELARAVGTVGVELGETLPLPCTRPDALARVDTGSCDHVWLVSVLTDPDHFPALHDRLYERRGELATGRGDPVAERRRAERLAREALRCLRVPGRLSTTDEELELFAGLWSGAGLRARVAPLGRLSAVVGDVVRSVRVTRARGRR